MDSVLAYAPKGSGLMTGLYGFMATPNRAVGVAMFLAGVTVDVLKTWWDRRQSRRGRASGGH